MWFNLGVNLGLLKRDDEATDAYERAAALAPSSEKPLINLAVIMRRNGEHDDALDMLERVRNGRDERETRERETRERRETRE